LGIPKPKPKRVSEKGKEREGGRVTETTTWEKLVGVGKEE
jgi:hypothetical protein